MSGSVDYWTFREAEVRLGEHQELRAALGLERVPDDTTLYRFLRRIDTEVVTHALMVAVARLPPSTPAGMVVVADAEFDSERNHHHIRTHLGADSIIPAKRGKSSWHLQGIRAQMQASFPTARYRQRTLVESVFSAAKRKLSARAPGRLPVTQHLQVLLLGLAYDIYRVRRALSLPLLEGCQQSQTASSIPRCLQGERVAQSLQQVQSVQSVRRMHLAAGHPTTSEEPSPTAS